METVNTRRRPEWPWRGREREGERGREGKESAAGSGDCPVQRRGNLSDNSNDLKRIQELEEEMVAARNMYNKEIQALHDQLDQNCKERMQIEMNNLKNSQMIAEFRESILALNTAVLQKEEEKKCIELLLCQKEAELRELMNNASNPSSEVDDLKRDLERLRCSLEEIQQK
ncbi:hypothetical protein chiPu_0012073 [Chiloscyllium punctatum]|uniref:Uncharacterized protein n=1 Tax=Chiloscyllium punctatum TaxID=137246 RepID=A0A401STA9_CHIPU|nr:hypothetical protein [Chiloscyllium punctatum]